QQSPINQTLQQHVLVLETLHVIERHYRQALETKEQVVFRDFYLFSNTPTTSETTVIPFGNGEAILAITKEVDILKTIEEENHFLRTLFQEQMNPILVLLKQISVFMKHLVSNPIFLVETFLI
ncbi:MAG: PAS domain S-box protein, partial [Kurthia sp.]|nr:PAS domain S-box protein [Kurthia sp.]